MTVHRGIKYISVLVLIFTLDTPYEKFHPTGTVLANIKGKFTIGKEYVVKYFHSLSNQLNFLATNCFEVKILLLCLLNYVHIPYSYSTYIRLTLA